MPTKSYAFAVGNVRAKEAGLLKKQDIEQLLSSDNVMEAANFLKDKGFGYADTPLDAEALLKDEEQKLWEYVASVAPDVSVFEAFTVENDFHNIKAVFKGTFMGVGYKHLLLKPALAQINSIEKAAGEQDFSALPEEYKEVAKKAYEALVKGADPQLCDALLDAACQETRLKAAENAKIPMLSEIVRATVFFGSIKAAIRCARAKKNKAFCETSISGTDIFDKKTLVNAALKGIDEVLTLLGSASKYRGAEAAQAYKESPSAFEKFADDFIMSVVVKAKYIAVGAEPLIAYLQAKLTEIKVARMVINGIATMEDDTKIREMLRELYG